MTTSVRTFPQANIESLAEDGLSLTPHEMACMLEEAFARNFIKPQPFIQLAPHVPLSELIAKDPMMGTMAEEMAKFAESRQVADARWKQKLMIWNNFGRYGLEKDEIAIFDRAKDGLETVEERLAAACYAIEAVKSRKAWKKEQNRAQDPEQYRDMTLTYDLPPRTKGKSHQPAFYSFTSPKGVKIDLYEPQGNLKRKLCKNPNEAFRAFMTRRGITINGGEVEILNRIMSEPMVEITNENGVTEKVYKWLPSYETTNCGAWFVKVGWRLNPKCTNSSYWVDANGKLTQSDPNKGITVGHEAYQAPLSLSQLDYHLLSESSDLAIENEDGEVVEFMNEEEEFLTCFPEREDENVFIDRSKYCEDDDETELLNAASGVIERSESGLTMGDLQSKEFTHDYLHQGIEDAKATIERCMKQEPSELGEQIIEWMQKKIARLMRLTELHNAFIPMSDNDSHAVVNYWYPSTHNMWTMGRTEKSVKEPVKTLPCMFTVPNGDIKVLTATPKPTKTRYAYRSGKTVEQVNQQRRMNRTERSIESKTFGQLVRRKSASDTFASTLDALLA